jgi:hypothetical protein
MKNSSPPSEPARFSGSLRHYHRSAAQTQRSWDEWVDGPGAKPRGNKSWLKTTAIIVAGLVLLGIAVGLAIELG